MNLVAGVYLIGGITLISEIPLPELPRIQQQSATLHPVQVRLGCCAHPPDRRRRAGSRLLRDPYAISFKYSGDRALPGKRQDGRLSYTPMTALLLSMCEVTCWALSSLSFASNADCFHCMQVRSPVNQESSLFWPTPVKANRRSQRTSLSAAFVCWPMTSVSSMRLSPVQPW